MLFDPLELPPATRVKIPRIRNGDIFNHTDDGDKTRARLLAVLATLIAENVNPQVHYNLHRDIKTIEDDIVSDIMIDTFCSIMQLLMDNNYKTFLAILQGMEAQQEAERDAMVVFANFVNGL